MLMRLAALGAASALLLTSCTSTPAADASAAASEVASQQAATDGTSATPTSGAAAQACAAYFQLDVLNSKYAGGAVANGNMTEAQVRADFTRLLKVMATQGRLAEADGSSDARLVRNALKMKKVIASLSRSQALSNLTKRQQAAFAKQSSRVEKACARAGYPLPADNTTARTAAGV